MEFIFIILLIGVFAFWWDSTKTSELALRYCQHLCKQSSVQLLDSSIAMERLWLRWGGSGIQLCRLYKFDFSGDGDSRRHGYIVLLGRHVAEQHMEPWPVVRQEE